MPTRQTSLEDVKPKTSYGPGFRWPTFSREEPLSPAQESPTFYRPELDLLRFLAFVCVFLTHGPRLVGQSGWRQGLAECYNFVVSAQIYGLCLFFFLSSYLITELLLRETRRYGAINLRWFYVRRLLRIWPLYYAALFLAAVLPVVLPVAALERRPLVAYALFFGYLVAQGIASPFGVLWSISVEEVFYLIWPVLSKISGNRMLWCSAAIVPISLLACTTGDNVWYNPVAHFLFFASGAMTAIVLGRSGWRLPGAVRAPAGVLGIGVWVSIVTLNHVLPPRQANPLAFLCADLGCLLIFLAFYGAQVGRSLAVNALLYLGRISYGLYVFHLLFLVLAERYLWGSRVGLLHFPLTQAVAGGATILVAAASHEWLEKPFIRLKRRYTPAALYAVETGRP